MPHNVLVLRFSSLGDVVLTSATITNIKINYPDCRIFFMTKEGYRPVVERIAAVDEVITIPDRCSAGKFVKIVMETDRTSFDLIVDLHANFRSFLARKMISAPMKVVYNKSRKKRELIVRRRGFEKAPPHTVDAYNAALDGLNMITPCRRPILVRETSSFRGRHEEVESAATEIVFAPGAAHEPKRWPIERFARLAELLHEMTEVRITWAVADGEKDLLERVKLPDSDRKAVGLSLPELIELVSSASLTVSNDSGVMHISSAVGTPVVALFGPTHPALGFSPRGLSDTLIEVDEFCRPCSLHGARPCYREEKFCFTRLEPEDVADVCLRVLEQAKKLTGAVFVDRDGTIIVDKHFLDDPQGIEFIPGSVEALLQLSRAGYKIVVVSNQSGIARGHFDLETGERVNARFLELLEGHSVPIAGLYFCPHHPDGTAREFSIRCDCRKPFQGMVESAAKQLGLDLRRSYVIGDKLDDVNLALAAGARPVLVKTGYGAEHSRAFDGNSDSVPVVDNLLAAARLILGKGSTTGSGKDAG